MVIALTGATGVLGGRLLEFLLREGHLVKCLVRNESRAQHLQNNKQIELVHGDLLDVDSLKELVRDTVTCYHLAAQVSLSQTETYNEVNITGTTNLCHAISTANPQCRLIYASTISALRVRPLLQFLRSTEYALSKRKAELALEKCARKTGSV